MYQIKIDSYPCVGGKFAIPDRKNQNKETLKEALEEYERIREEYHKNGKRGYGKIVLCLRRTEERKEVERIRFEIL